MGLLYLLTTAHTDFSPTNTTASRHAHHVEFLRPVSRCIGREHSARFRAGGREHIPPHHDATPLKNLAMPLGKNAHRTSSKPRWFDLRGRSLAVQSVLCSISLSTLELALQTIHPISKSNRLHHLERYTSSQERMQQNRLASQPVRQACLSLRPRAIQRFASRRGEHDMTERTVVVCPGDDVIGQVRTSACISYLDSD